MSKDTNGDTSTNWQQGFYDAIKAYFGIPLDTEITLNESHDQMYSGCPTCGYGGSDDWEVTVSWYETKPGPRGGKGKKRYYSKTYQGSMLEFMQSL